MCQKKYCDSEEFKNMVDFQNSEIKMTFPILDWAVFDNQLWDKNHSEEKKLFNKACESIKEVNPFKELAFNSNKENMYHYCPVKVD